MRKARKDEHIEQYMKTTMSGETLLSDVYIEHNSLPECDWEEICTGQEMFGKHIRYPFLINALTGGTETGEQINQELAMLAKEFHIPLQVGSQSIALEDPQAMESFTVIRSVLGDEDVVIGNLSAHASVEEVCRAQEMLQADGMGIHLNVAQELAMEEGDRAFRGWERNLKNICDALPGKIILKEVGFGISEQTAERMKDWNCAYIDVSGAGGTNFVEIENLRNRKQDLGEFYHWGIPTAKALWNVTQAQPKAQIIASGGIRKAQDMLRCFGLGADLCAIGGELLRYLLMGGYQYARDYLYSLTYNLQVGMMLLGCRNIAELQKYPYRLTGRLRDITQ